MPDNSSTIVLDDSGTIRAATFEKIIEKLTSPSFSGFGFVNAPNLL
jgi:primase-polymerase (primpol)-like protein